MNQIFFLIIFIGISWRLTPFPMEVLGKKQGYKNEGNSKNEYDEEIVPHDLEQLHVKETFPTEERDENNISMSSEEKNETTEEEKWFKQALDLLVSEASSPIDLFDTRGVDVINSDLHVWLKKLQQRRENSSYQGKSFVWGLSEQKFVSQDTRACHQLSQIIEAVI